MDAGKKIYMSGGIQPNDCFVKRAIWTQEDNDRAHYNHIAETQCKVSTRSVEEVMDEVLELQQAQCV